VNPFSPRSVAARRDADLEDEARRDVEAFERDNDRDALREAVEIAAAKLLVAWLYAEEHGLDPDQAVGDALAALDDMRARPATPDHEKENDHV
jgi:hypothetical protein